MSNRCGIIKGILFFWWRALMSIKTEFESPVVWFVFVSIIICILPSECLSTIAWLTTTWMSWIQLILLFPGRGGLEQSLVSCVRFVMAGTVAVSQVVPGCPRLTKTFRIIICIKGHHFIQETSDIINNKLENHLATQFSNSLGVGFYDRFELQVRVWSGIIS